jgi:hypothetical protein
MNLAQEEHKDFILEYKKFQEQFDKLLWRKNPDWFLKFKEFKDETFKPIDEYQGFYFISNYGKVVSFKRKSPGERRSTMINGFLAVSLNHFGSIKIHYIHELVYTHFVRKIKPFHRVVHKDKNVTNNHYKNLEEVTITELLESKNIEKSDETSPLTHDQMVKVEKPGKPVKPAKFLKRRRRRKSGKPPGELDAGVLQFTREGKFVREYFSIREAGRDLKINAKLIMACLKGESKLAADCQWFYRADPNFDDGIFDIASITPSIPSIQSTARASKPIDQYDREGKFIREFPSVTEAAKAVGVSPGAISFSMQKPNRTAAGYIWKLKEK